MEKLTLEEAKRLNAQMVTEDHLLLHAANVSACMGAFAEHFGEDPEEWEAVGWLHDYDFEKFPDEHLAHTEAELRAEGVDEADIRAILSHGWGIVNDVRPETDLEKSLYTADELSGIVWAAALMRPTGISDLEPKSVLKKFKDKKFAAKCDRDVIRRGVELLGMDLAAVVAVCIDGMKPYAAETGLHPKPQGEQK